MAKQLLSNAIATIEKNVVVSKYRSAEADEQLVNLKNRMFEAFKSEFEKKANLRKFVQNAENVSKLRSVITDATCEVTVCSGVIELFKQCNPNIFNLFPNYTAIPCDGKKDVKFAKKGKYLTFAPSTTLADLVAVGDFTDLTLALKNEILLGCVTKSPKVVEGKYVIPLNEEFCNEGDALRMVCFTVETLAQLEEHLTLSAQFEAIKAMKAVANTVTPATGTLKDIVNDLVDKANSAPGAVSSTDKFLFVNQAIIERMAMQTFSQGAPLFPTLRLECGSLYCDVFCIDGVVRVVVLSEEMLPKVTGKYQLLLVKADQMIAGDSEAVISELPNDLATLLNAMNSKVAGYKPYMMEEITEFAGKTTYTTLIS
ncbi:MAG: hypothetical protein ACRC80_38525 [Waterburya sp.]